MLQQSDIIGIIIATYVFGLAALGCVFFSSLARRALFAAFCSAIGLLFYESFVDARTLFGSKTYVALLFFASSLAITAIFSGIFRLRTRLHRTSPSIRERLREALVPSEWCDDARSISAKDKLKRWFVAVAAGTGCCVGQIIGQNAFWSSLRNVFSPFHILTMLLLTAVAIVLIGPVDEIVVGGRALVRDDSGTLVTGPIEDVLSDLYQHFSWKRAGRMGLVALFFLCVNVISSCLESSVGNPATLFLCFMAAFVPATVSYYWCAALEIDGWHISRRAGWATFTFGSVLASPVALLSGILYSLAFFYLTFTLTSQHLGYFAALPAFLAAIVALVIIPLLLLIFAGSTNSLFGFIGGWALDQAHLRGHLRGVTPTLLLGGLIGLSFCLLVSTAVAISQAAFGTAGVLDYLRDRSVFLTVIGFFGVFQLLGWTAGLIVSGFPEIVRSSDCGCQPTQINRSFFHYRAWPILIGALGLIPVFVFAIFTINTVMTQLGKTVDSMQHTLPLQFSDGSKLVAISHSGTLLSETFAFAPQLTQLLEICCHDDSSPVVAQLHRASKLQICADKLSNALLGIGGTIVRTYQDASGKQIARFTLSVKDCQAVAG